MKHPPIINRARRQRQTQSKAEALLWQSLRKHTLNGWGFRRQAPVGDFVVDFLCHAPAMIIEVDGPAHDDAEQKAFDAMREEKLRAFGFVVIRTKERFVRERMLDVEAWIKRCGAEVLSGASVSQPRLEHFPHP